MYVVNYYDETRKKIKTFSNSSLLKNLPMELSCRLFRSRTSEVRLRLTDFIGEQALYSDSIRPPFGEVSSKISFSVNRSQSKNIKG